MDFSPLDNVIWSALHGEQAALASGTASIRRYARGYTPLIGASEPARPDFAALAPSCGPDEDLYVFGWTGPVPDGWLIEDEAMLTQMVWASADVPSASKEAFRRLRTRDLPQVLALVEATHPGPFGPRTVEMGEYFGAFDRGRLVAMAGERMHAGPFREVSGVCTDPGWQGQGLAERLVKQVAGLQRRRGQWPFLHVLAENRVAQRVYERSGFRRHREFVARVVRRTDG